VYVQAGIDCRIDSSEELQEFLMSVSRLALGNNRSFQDVQSRKQGGGSVALVIMSLTRWQTGP